jgi:predicted acylesterase/phospholipase RssA
MCTAIQPSFLWQTLTAAILSGSAEERRGGRQNGSHPLPAPPQRLAWRLFRVCPMDYQTAWPPKRFQILALDGGGMRGLYTASLLSALESELGSPILNHFDLVAGTSTGGIIALGLGLGKTPQEMVAFYRNDGPKIFPRPTGIRAWFKHLFGVKYDAAELERVLKREFEEQKLGDSSRALVIPTYNLDRDAPVVLKTPHHEEFRDDPKLEAWKAALATSAAPTYLPASSEIRDCRHVDGGMWANNPALVGVIEAYHFLAVPLDAIRVLSIGTGSVVKNRSDTLSRGGRWAWRGEAADVLLNAQSAGTDNQVQLLLGDERVMRINPTVPLTWGSLDVSRREFAGHGKEDAKIHGAAISTSFLRHKGLALSELRNAIETEKQHA